MFIKRHFVTIHFLISLFAQCIAAITVGLALLPSYYLVRLAWGFVSNRPDNILYALLFCLSLGAAILLAGNMLLLSVILTRFVLRLRNEEAVAEFRMEPGKLWNNAGHSFLMNLAQHTFLPFVRGTPIIVWFYMAMGARIGRGTLITSTRLFDVDLIEIGKGCVIGGGVSITAHSAEKDKGFLLKVIIGDYVTIGADTVVMPGVTIEDNVIVGANSVIPKGMRLEANAIYAGVPVKKLRKKQAG